MNQCRLVSAIKFKDVDRLAAAKTSQRSQNLKTSIRYEEQNPLTKLGNENIIVLISLMLLCTHKTKVLRG